MARYTCTDPQIFLARPSVDDAIDDDLPKLIHRDRVLPQVNEIAIVILPIGIDHRAANRHAR